jgi:hypothetical protein
MVGEAGPARHDLRLYDHSRIGRPSLANAFVERKEHTADRRAVAARKSPDSAGFLRSKVVLLRPQAPGKMESRFPALVRFFVREIQISLSGMLAR